MRIKNTATNFGLVTKFLHWLIGLSIIFLIWLGWYMVDLGYYDKWYYKSLDWHKSLGMLVLGFALVKISWQFYSPTPEFTASLAKWERIGAHIMHHVLIVLMFLIPVTGFLISTSSGQAVSVFDWFDIPALISKNTSLRDIAIELHFYLSYATGVLVIGHAGAAVKHQFINKDGTLARMLWK